ncbi:MAG TPA: hypothetical protein VK511_03605 [Gemmatimonadaceae bacterium]|nr:hypothetical protein [Gemmatimonadaceae bacterium]
MGSAAERSALTTKASQVTHAMSAKLARSASPRARSASYTAAASRAKSSGETSPICPLTSRSSRTNALP